MAFGPDAARPLEERIARRLPELPPEQRRRALDVAREAVHAAESLARESAYGPRAESSVPRELLERFPWLRLPEARPRAWRRLLSAVLGEDRDLARRLAHYGFYLVK